MIMASLDIYSRHSFTSELHDNILSLPEKQILEITKPNIKTNTRLYLTHTVCRYMGYFFWLLVREMCCYFICRLSETKGPSPVSWPTLEPLFIVGCKRRRPDLMRRWDILQNAAPSVSGSGEGFKPVEHAVASLPVHVQSIAGHQTLMKGRCREENGEVKETSY